MREYWIWVLVGITFLLSFIIQPFLRYRNRKNDKESYLQFRNKLKIGDFVLLSSGIFGRITQMNSEKYSVEIADKVIIQVIPQAIIGIDKERIQG
ncbi:preprotein translocase subunit YajC [Trichococcus collinsii]|uniref:preprotein translocase subunit YajC n=1 Tax=Trichococcus collinsii TaxID=157076 RepID=UPI0007A84C88|nr:preprotein translocase subunit YajC [Trichococcus collinsii]CZQ95911.1 preprotein translocase yajc [Trichococcus collinsii]